MNTQIIENELMLIRDQSRKYPQLSKILENNLSDMNSQQLLQQLLPLISQSKNTKLVLQGISLIQKLRNLQLLKIESFDIIMDFFNNSKLQQDETIDIRLVSTLIHIIGPDVIDFSTINTILKVLNLLIYFSSSNYPIVAQSSIQGIITLSNVFEEILQTQQSNNVQQCFYELLELLFSIFQDKEQQAINVSNNLILCKDIFIIILKCGKPLLQIDQFHSFYENLYQHLLNIDILQESNIMNSKYNIINREINSIRLIFNYIIITEDKFDLIIQLMTHYQKLQPFDQSKIAIHDGILCLYSNLSIFLNLLLRQPSGNLYNDYNELILKFLYQYSLYNIREFQNQQSPKQNILINKFTASYIDCNLQTIPNIFIQQTKTLIQIITDNIQKFQLQEEQHGGLMQEIKNQSRMYHSQINEQDDQITDVQETESDDIKFKTLFDKLWRPLLRVLKQILKIANNQQYSTLLEYLQQWIQISLQLNQTTSFQLLIRFLAAQSAPQSLKYIETDKWIISCKIFQEILSQNINQLNAKTWNLVFQTLQRIEQVVTKQTEVKMTTEIFINSNLYSDNTLFQMVDGLNQLALQVSERMQLSQKKTFDLIYKSFAIDKLLITINQNWHRIQKIWRILDALYLCLCSSKVLEMRINAQQMYRELVFSGIEYSKTNQIGWKDEWIQHLLNPLSELILSPFQDVVENMLQLLSILLKDFSKYIPDETFALIIKLLEQSMAELFIKASKCISTEQGDFKSVFLRIVLSIECLSEIVFNHIERVDQQTLAVLSKILVSFNKQEQFNTEITHKIICMTWQVSERLIRLEIKDQEMWLMTKQLLKNCLEVQDDLKYASIHIASQISIIAKDIQFNEIFSILEELVLHSVEYYLKIEQHQLSLIQQTPRFTQLPQETPKFSGSIKQMLFDKSTSMQLFKQQFELMKLCISKVIQVIVTKQIYPKFFYYLQVFNQAQCVYVKHEIVLACQKVIESNNDKQILLGAIDFITTLLNYEQQLDIEDIQYYLDNHTFNVCCDIIKQTLLVNSKKAFHVLALLLHFNSQEIILQYLNDQNNVFKYYFKSCFQNNIFTDDLKIQWMGFINQQISSLSVSQKHHFFIEFVSNCFEMIIEKPHDSQIEEATKFTHAICSLLSKCQRNLNDSSEKLQLILITKLKNILTILIPYLEYSVIQQILEPLINSQLSNKRTQDWVTFFINDAQYKNEEQHDTVVQLFTNYYVCKLDSSDINAQSSIIIYLMDLQNNIKLGPQTFSQSIQKPLLNSIYKNLDAFINESESSNERQFNVQLMLDYLMSQSKDDLKEFYMIFVELIKSESFEIRNRLIPLLGKFF